MILWCAGIAIAFARLAWACLNTRRIIATARFGDRRVDPLAARAGACFGMSEPPRVGISSDPVSPFVYGAWSPAVILPQCLVAQASDEQLMVVLAHEFAHVRRRDPLLGWFFALMHALYFFHPVLPLVKRQLLLERERACDDWVLAVSSARPSTYARVLVAVAALCSGPHTATPRLLASGSFHDLEARLHSLGHGANPRPRLSRGVAALLLVAGLLTAPGIAFSNRSVVPSAIEAAAPLPESPPSIDIAVEVPVQEVIVGAVVLADAGDSAPAAAPDGTRLIHFPRDQVVGTLRIKDAAKKHHIDSFYYWTDNDDWSILGPAQGEVTIPAGMDAWLTLNVEASQDLSFLDRLLPGDLYRLSSPYAEAGERNLPDDQMVHIAGLTGLRELELRWCDVSDEGLLQLNPQSSVERLWLSRKAGDRGLAHVATMENLQALYMGANETTDAGFEHISALAGLRELELGGGELGDAALVHVARLPRLEHLVLFGVHFTDRAMDSVAEIDSLRNLNVSNVGLTNRGIQAITRLPELETLNLYGVKDITGVALRHLQAMKNLRKLDLSSPPGVPSRIDNYSLRYLAQCRSLEHVVTPRSIDDSGLASLSTLPNLKRLDVMADTSSPITDAGLAHVTSIRTLESLMIGGGKGLTDTGLEHLSALSELRNLYFMCGSPGISNSGMAALAKLKKLTELDVKILQSDRVTVAGLTQLNALTSLTQLRVYGARQDETVLDLSALRQLASLDLYVEGGYRDEDVACLAGLTQLRSLGINGIGDTGLAHLAGLTRMQRLTVRGKTITDAGLAHLSGMTVLDLLSIRGSITGDGLRHLEGLKGITNLSVESRVSLDERALQRLIVSLPNLYIVNGANFGAGV